MPPEEANQAELAFFGAVLSDAPLDKEAVDLDPEIKALLEDSSAPSDLDALEESAAAPPETAPEETPAEPQAGVVDREDRPPDEELGPEPELPDRASHGGLFADRRSHPVQLLEVLTQRYKTAWAEWEPETLWWTLRRDFGPVGTLTRNKIGALRVAATTDMPWLDWDVFEKCGLSWNDMTPVFGETQLMTPAQLAFTVQVLTSIREDEQFSHEVSAYFAAILDDHGWVYAPEDWFPGAQEILDRRDWLIAFKVEAEDAWLKVQDVPVEDVDWNDEEPLDVHLLKLGIVKRYLEERETLHQVVPGSTAISLAPPPIP